MFELPSNVTINVNLTTVAINFEKSSEVVTTKIDAYWIDGQGTYDNETAGNAFNFEGLSFGTTYKFKLKAISATSEELESAEYEFSTPALITPTVPTNIIATVDSTIKNNVAITFTKGAGVKTQINAYWIDGSDTWDSYTTDSGFVFEGLGWGTTYTFKLRSISNDGITVAESGEVSFTIEEYLDTIPPTAPTGITATVSVSAFENQPKNSIAIAFTKGEGIRTEIDAYWLNGQGTWEQSTSEQSFTYENLPFATQYKFKLRTVAYNELTYAESEEVTFVIDSVLIPTIPTNIVIGTPNQFSVNNVQLSFIQGIGGTTEILKSWGDGANTTWNVIDSEDDYLFSDLNFETSYSFKLRSVTPLGLTATTDVINFAIPKAIIPTIPTNINYVIDADLLNQVTITFAKGNGVRTEIDINGAGAWSEYTTDQGFILKELEFGQTYTFQLRSVGNNGQYALSKEYSFTIKEIEPVEKPTNIEITRNRFNVVISFEKGEGALTTEICKLWEGSSYSNPTDGTEFDLGELTPGKTYRFRLRSVGVEFRDRYNNRKPNYAITEKIKFEMPEYRLPILPPDLEVEVQDYNALITYTPAEPLHYGLKKAWWHDGINDKQERKYESYNWKYDNPSYDELNEEDKNYSDEDFENSSDVKTIAETCDETTSDKGFYLERLGSGVHTFKLVVFNDYEESIESNDTSFTIAEGYKCVLTKPTPPTAVSYVVGDNNCTIKFKKGNGNITEINRCWEDEPLTFGARTLGSAFYYEGLDSNSTYYFKLRTVNSLGETAESEVFSFTTLASVEGDISGANEEWVIDAPTVPTDISFETEGTSCTISFTPGVGSRTEINRLWIDGSGTYGEYTTDSAFHFDGLETGVVYKFRLRSKNSLNQVAETGEISFSLSRVDGEVVDNSTPTAPTNITYVVDGTCFTVKFTKGSGVRTEIDRHWIEATGTWGAYTHDEGFYFDNLTVGTEYKFKLRSINSLGETAETSELVVTTLAGSGGDGYYVDVKGDVPDGYYSNYEEKWFFTPNGENKPVGVTGDIAEKFEDYGVYYCGNPNIKAVYLTFDEGYETGNTSKILDTLRASNVRATFFITKKYLDENNELVKRMVREGHTVANHSSTHPAMANVARTGGFEGVEKELKNLENEFKNLTGAKMLNFFRPPMGKYSEEALYDIKKLGYKTALWSFAYSDFDTANQKDPTWVLDYATSCAFNGCIYLLHAVSSTNATILGDLISYLKENSYTIKDLRSLVYDCQI